MKYCKKCGTQLKDDAKFCIKCGQPVATPGNAESNNQNPGGYQQPPHSYGNNNPVNPHGKSKKTWIGIGVGVIVVVLILMFIFNPALRMKGYEKPVYYTVKFIEKGDIKSMAKAIPLKQLVKFAKDKAGSLLDLSELDLEDYKDALDSLNDAMEDYKDALEDEYGDNFKVEYEIKKAEQVEDLDDIQDRYDEVDMEVKDAYNLKVKVVMEGDDKKDKETSEFKVVKIDNKWYLDLFSLLNGF